MFDIWCGEQALNSMFPVIFRLASDNFAAVSDLFSCSNGVIQWGICLTRAVQDWEIDEVSTFFSFYTH